MEMKVAATCFQLSQPVLPRSHSCSQALASPSSLCRKEGGNSLLVCRYDHSPERSVLFGSRTTTKLHRSRSFEYSTNIARTIKRACSAGMESYSDEEFCNNLQDIALRLQLSYVNDDGADSVVYDSESEIVSDGDIGVTSLQNVIDFPVEQPDWPEPAEGDWSIERKANSLDIPLSLRMIKKKIKGQQGVQEASESTCCSVKKAFSSMVFIIRELQSYTLQMREFLFYEDLQGILVRVHKEMNASFVWLFQQVFSQTPTLMMYVMILLANFSVHSMASNSAIAAAIPLSCSHTEISSVMETQDQQFDSSVMRRFSASSSSGKTTSIGGNNGGSGNIRPTSNGTDGFDGSDKYRTVLPDVAPQVSSLGSTSETESASGEENEHVMKQWDSIVEEASEMQMRDEALDHETMQRLVAPVDVKIEPNNFMDYLKTEMFYRTQLVLDPNNPLILANYAQFLYLVVRDNARAEKYFKKATAVEGADAEAYSKYATFLWRAKNDLWRAEETFLEAISADPTNSYHAANYAHFLWNTGGEDTCYPLT